MPTYKEIENANKQMIPTDIKGRNYMEVPQRVKAFRMVYPTGTITTEMLSNDNGVCIFKATVGYINDESDFVVLGTGTAYEKEGSTFINKTSYIENCETSAVGRALGMAGFGIDTSIASAEEVQNAIANQGTDDRWIKAIEAECRRTGIKKADVYKSRKISTDSQLTRDIFDSIMRSFEKTPSKASA